MNAKYKIGVFDDEGKLISSIKKLQEKGCDIHEVYMPYAIIEVLHLLKRKTRLPTAAYFYGLIGGLSVLAFLYYASVISWPIVYGGKPLNSFPSFLIITIVLLIFIVTIASLATFSVVSKLYPGRKNVVFHEGATDDLFLIVLDRDAIGEEKYLDAGDLFIKEGAIEVTEKEPEPKPKLLTN